MCGCCSLAVVSISARKRVAPTAAASLGFENLECDIAVVPFVKGKIDRGHGALTELALDSVPACEGLVEAGDGGERVHLPR
jgi:hypothetical protein